MVLAADPRPVPWAPEIHVGEFAPDVALIDERGMPFRFSQLRGSNVVLSFVSTRCGDICPLVTARFAQIAERERGSEHIRLLEVSIDPDYDRPAVLRAYRAQFGVEQTRWQMATGNRNDVLGFAARFGATPSANTTGGIDHEGRTILLDADGRAREVLDGVGWSPEDVIASFGGGFEPLPWWSKAWNRICGGARNHFERVVLLMVALAALGVALFKLFGERSTGDNSEVHH